MHSQLSLSLSFNIHAAILLAFTVHISKEVFIFGGRKYVLLGESDFTVVVYNASQYI